MKSDGPRIINLKADYEDTRGTITDIIRNEAMRRVTIVYSKKGSIRGNHFHKRAGHYLFIIQGKFRFAYKRKAIICKQVIKSGDLVWIPKKLPHAFEAIDDTKSLEIASTDYGQADTHSVAEPLIKKEPRKFPELRIT